MRRIAPVHLLPQSFPGDILFLPQEDLNIGISPMQFYEMTEGLSVTEAVKCACSFGLSEELLRDQKTISEEKRKPFDILRVGEDGKSVSAQLRCRAAAVERDDYLFEGTVRENVQIGNPDASRWQVDAVLKELGILHLSERLVGVDHRNLSGGEQKRVAIARALLKDADLFFLDEPDNGLDADTRAWLIHWLNETDQTVVLISHDPELTAEIPAARRMRLPLRFQR